MRLLELFCGTKSVSKAIGSQFSEVISVDIDAKSDPTICVDILEWNYKTYPTGYFHTIWASPPCTEFSRLNYALPNKILNLDLADSIVKRTIEIIEYFNPDRFFIENPRSGTLKDREYMLGIPFIDLDYCRFSNWGYRKQTRFWTSEEREDRICQGRGVCPNMRHHKHIAAIGKSSFTSIIQEGKTGLQQRHSIPPDLVKYLF
jgi:site-specific DNA-cytosine methylase